MKGIAKMITYGDEIEICEVAETHYDLIGKIKQAMLPAEVFKDLAELYRIFGDPTRIKIVYILFEHECCVCDIAAILDTTQSNVSHQLQILKAADLVSFRREGKQIIYSLKDSHVKDIFEKGYEHLTEEK